MMNKEEIEKLETTIEDYKLMRLNNCSYEVEGELFIVLEKLLKEYKRQKELNKEHQKLNGELQKKLTEYEKQLDLDYVEENYVKKSVFLNLLKENGELKDRLIIAEEICKGKTIQEMGMSDLYEEKKDD